MIKELKIYIYIYIYRERERERERDDKTVPKAICLAFRYDEAPVAP